MDRTERFEREGDKAAEQGRDIQAPIDAKEARASGGDGGDKAVQAGDVHPRSRRSGQGQLALAVIPLAALSETAPEEAGGGIPAGPRAHV